MTLWAILARAPACTSGLRAPRASGQRAPGRCIRRCSAPSQQPDRRRTAGGIGISSIDAQLPQPAGGDPPERLRETFDRVAGQLAAARPFAKTRYRDPALDVCRRLLASPGGRQFLYGRVGDLEDGGLFAGTDWQDPAVLSPALVGDTLTRADGRTAVLEMVSEIRLVAVANGDLYHPGIVPEQARHFLTQVLALNLNRLLSADGEAQRSRTDDLAPVVAAQFAYLRDTIGLEDIIDRLIEEIWRIMEQRPIQVDQVKNMIGQIAVALQTAGSDSSEGALGADRLVSAAFGPTTGSRDDPGLAEYGQRLAAMDDAALQREASGFARAMHDTGLVSAYHTSFLRFLVDHDGTRLLPAALGLSSTGIDCLRCYEELIHHLIVEAVGPATSQTVYGLACLLERGVLYVPPVAPALWRQSVMPLSASAAGRLESAFGAAVAPRTRLLAGVINLLGLPLGVGQGNNPTCQAARSLSMWSYSDPDYLLYLVAHAAAFDDITMRFEGQPISGAAAAAAGPPSPFLLDVDPVSVLLVPLLNGVYQEMGRRCADRGEDPHRWINREMHGWWVGGEFNIAVDVRDGALLDLAGFLQRFWISYHPLYNGNQPVIHPQPAGVAVTDGAGRFVGWHAITILRTALDRAQVMRVYFFNPNNDSGQNWGQGVEVSTQGHGERNGEASLPFVEFASRLYIFHGDPLQRAGSGEFPPDEIEAAMTMARQSWGSERAER